MNDRSCIVPVMPGRHGPVEWQSVPVAPIDRIPWTEYPVRYESNARVAAFMDGLAVRLVSEEPEPVAIWTQQNDPVCRDSCLEFFFEPSAGAGRYFNFEFNPAGTLYLGLGSCRADSKKLWPGDYRDLFEIKRIGGEGCWGIEFFIPFVFLHEHMPEFAGLPLNARGNFYKCGDETPQPHYQCWNMIRTPFPDFHRPEFFGRIVSDR